MSSETPASEPQNAPSLRAHWLHVLLGLFCLGSLIWAGSRYAGQAEANAVALRHRPIEVHMDGYVSSDQCRACHLEQHRTWHRSYHRTMTQPATPETVFGDFDGVSLEHRDQHAKLSRVGDRFFAELDPWMVPSRDGKRREDNPTVPIVLVTGSHHMQVYWYETGVERALGQLPFVYLRDEERFIPRNQAFIRPPGKLRPPETGRWNTSCINCHTTHGQPRVTSRSEIDTRVAEFGIACEACHGPGREHVIANSAPWARYRRYFESEDDETIVNPKKLDHQRASEICSQCHAIWQFANAEARQRANTHGFPLRPGETPPSDLLLYQPSHRDDDEQLDALMAQHPRYTAGQFWPDGMARVSGREFNGMIDSPCFERGELSCLSCHTMHQRADDPRSLDTWANDQLAVQAEGDAGCTQCHEEVAGDLEQHTHHPAQSAGSRCYNCHMPHTSYGLLKAIRTHEITSPDAAVSAETGRPNACNICHLDKSLGWTARQLSALYDAEPAALDDEHAEISAAALHAIKGDAGQRALVAWAMGWPPALEASGRDWIAPYLGLLMDDAYDAVRLIAHRSLRELGDFSALPYDSVQGPRARDPIGPEVARHAETLELSGSRPAVPEVWQDDGEPTEQVDRLLKQRDRRPIDLLE